MTQISTELAVRIVLIRELQAEVSEHNSLCENYKVGYLQPPITEIKEALLRKKPLIPLLKDRSFAVGDRIVGICQLMRLHPDEIEQILQLILEGEEELPF